MPKSTPSPAQPPETAGRSDDFAAISRRLRYDKQPHLNNKYTVFGRVIDGHETLDAMEKVPVGKKDRPLTEIKLASQAARVAAHAHAAEAIERERLRRVAEAPDEIRWALRRPRQEAVARSRQDVGYREA